MNISMFLGILAAFCAIFLAFWLFLRRKVLVFLAFIAFLLLQLLIIICDRMERMLFKYLAHRITRKFECAIHNIGLKGEINVGECHAVFNTLRIESIQQILKIYCKKAQDADNKNYWRLIEITVNYLKFRRAVLS